MKCAREGCNKQATGKSKYCPEHKAEARQAWLEMIHAKQGEPKPDYAGIYREAMAAARAAGAAAKPTPMVVQQHANMLDDHSPVVQSFYVSDGVCGFASAKFYPATTSFARWLLKNKYAHTSYGGGCEVSMGLIGNQSLERKEAAASAFIEVIRKHLPDIRCYMTSRLD